MYLCLCYGISERKVREIIDEGQAKNVREIQKICRAGQSCGSCLCDLKKMLSEDKAKKSPQTLQKTEDDGDNPGEDCLF